MSEPLLRKMNLQRYLRLLLSQMTRSKGAIRARVIIHRIGIRLSIYFEYRASLVNDRTLIQRRSNSSEIRICVSECAETSSIAGLAEMGKAEQNAAGNTIRVSALLNEKEIGHDYISYGSTYVPEIDRVVTPIGVYIWDLFVSPEYRSRGVGRAILQEGMVYVAKKLNHGLIHALVEKDNYCSRELFESMRFKRASLVFMLKLRGFSRLARLGDPSLLNETLKIELLPRNPERGS